MWAYGHLLVRAVATNAALALVALSLAAHYSPAQAAENTPPGVLILHSNQRPTPAQVVIEDTLRAVVLQELKRPVQIFSEYLDDEWTSLQSYGTEQAGLLLKKYGGRNINIIVADALPALRFETEFRERMFPGVPIVYLAVAVDRVDTTALPADVVGVLEDHDPTPTLKLALSLHPEAKRLVLIRGASEPDRLWDKRLRTAAERLNGDLEIEYLAGLPTDGVLRRVAALPRDAIVFTPGYFVDGAGQVSTPRQATERIAQASAAPVYGAFDTLIGAGIVGGYVSRYEDEAKQAGAIIVRLLNGTALSEIPPTVATRVPMVDLRQVRRWGVDERLLPRETIVSFREPTAWEKYWREFSLGIAVVVLQAILIGALLFETRSRRRTAMALEESQKQIHLAARAARLSWWIWDATRDKLRAAAKKTLRPDPSGKQPTAFDELVASAHPADRQELEQAVEKALATGDDLDVEFRVVESDGDVRWVAARGRAEQGEPKRLLGVALDITERKAADLRSAQDRTALRHMTRVSTVGQLSAAIAHQLNQPLAAILGNAEAAQKMLTRENIDLPELRAICTDIVSDDHRATEVIRRLSDLYNRGDTKVVPIDLNRLIRDTLDLLRTELLIRHVTPMIDLAPDLPVIEGGYVQLQQVVLNLVVNAADAMSGIDVERRMLTIRTERCGADVRLCVIDSGSGIAADDMDKVFDPFWSTKTGNMSMGMGLAVCQSIVSAHRGRIAATNNADGGATFCVILPTKQPS